MARTLNIFIGADAELDQFAPKLERLVGLDLKKRSDELETRYEYADDEVVITLGEHDYVNDQDLNFEDFRFYIGIRARSKDTEELRARHRKEWAARIFGALKHTGKYPLMLVQDVSRRLEEFRPADERKRSAVHRATLPVQDHGPPGDTRVPGNALTATLVG